MQWLSFLPRMPPSHAPPTPPCMPTYHTCPPAAHAPHHTCHLPCTSSLPYTPPPPPCMAPSQNAPSHACPSLPPPWAEFLTHACENITFPQLLLRTVNICHSVSHLAILFCYIIYRTQIGNNIYRFFFTFSYIDIRAYPHRVSASASTLAKDPIDWYCAKHTKHQRHTQSQALT